MLRRRRQKPQKSAETTVQIRMRPRRSILKLRPGKAELHLPKAKSVAAQPCQGVSIAAPAATKAHRPQEGSIKLSMETGDRQRSKLSLSIARDNLNYDIDSESSCFLLPVSQGSQLHVQFFEDTPLCHQSSLQPIRIQAFVSLCAHIFTNSDLCRTHMHTHE